MQPHISVQGLWKLGDWFYAVCPDLNQGLTAKDGQPLQAWFESSGRAITSPIQVSATVPQGATRVPERTAEERAMLRGEPLTTRDVYVELSLALPKDFPKFEFDTIPPNAFVYVPVPLTELQARRLNEIYERLEIPLKLNIKVDSSQSAGSKPFRRKVGMGDIDLIPSQNLADSFSKELKHLWEEDEDFWVDHRKAVLATTQMAVGNILPKAFINQGSRCLVNAAVFPTKNLRTYLTLYKHVTLVTPLTDHYSNALATLQVNEQELVELASRGRVQFLLPHSLEWYPPSLLQKLVDVAPTSLLFSRRLTAATIVDSRRRMPLLYPPFGTLERAEFLRTLQKAESDPILGNVVQALIDELARIWTTAESFVHYRGAMATGTLGAGAIIAAINKQLTGRDVFLELSSSSSSVEWAGVLGATVFPVEVDGYSDQVACEVCASVYSGVRKEKVLTSFGEVETIVQGLLALDNDAPILEVEEAFANSDIDRLGQIVQKIAENSLSAEFLNTEIQKLNERVKAYERHSDRLNRINLTGLSAAVAGIMLLSNPTATAFIPFTQWFVEYLLKNADPSKDFGGRLIDWIRGVNAWTTGDIVLVSRLRAKLQD
jgi:hypothetical protein